MYRLNEDWQEFSAALHSELHKLNATAEETESVLDAAYIAATEVEDVASFAEEELSLVREHGKIRNLKGQFGIPVLLNCGCDVVWAEGESLWNTPDFPAWCNKHGDTTVREIYAQ